MLRPLFISHCAEDHDVATRVCDHLESQGIACWIAPRDIPPGANFDAQIVDAIDGAIALVLLLSARANDSPFVKNEVNLAFSAGKPIFTVRVENVAPSRALHLYTATHQWINLISNHPQ